MATDLMRSFIECWEIELLVYGPLTNVISTFHWLVTVLLCLVPLPPRNLTLTMANSYSLELLRGWQMVKLSMGTLSFGRKLVSNLQVSNSQELQVQALNASSSVNGVLNLFVSNFKWGISDCTNFNLQIKSRDLESKLATAPANT